jgi:hypothetical protein
MSTLVKDQAFTDDLIAMSEVLLNLFIAMRGKVTDFKDLVTRVIRALAAVQQGGKP